MSGTPNSVAAAVRDAQIVVNLVGVLAESRAQTFNAVQAEGAAAIARAAAAQGARLVHVSAIGADENSEIRLRAQQGRRREGGVRRRSVCHDLSSVGGVRPR